MGDLTREDAGNMLRILVATDCHLGYMEKDEVRRHDSFQAFEEICSIAEKKKVDFLLLGGDLFHENKPSRSTLVKAIEILRRYCLNDRPVQFEVVSDQTINFQNIFGHVNYEDPHFNVGLPVFSIHGNHDDPAGVDNLSAIDILSTCNLVNYFGKMVLGGSGVGEITLSPILIRKGATTVALYGLGNIRDERLNRMFQTPHAVQWMRPEPQEGCQVSDWFNILVLHQNRVKTNPKNAINEHFLPRFLDFIVWGHEHECIIDPQEVPGMGFHITQPGSSIATSLIDGESKPKHVLLLEIKGNQYRPTKIPLTSIRPFEYAEVVLKDVTDIDPNDQSSILEHLDKVVRNLIEKSSKKAANMSELKLPLIRIKVDYSGFMTINPQRFGQKYVGKVANPQDILIFSKASRKGRSESAKFDDSERLRPEELNQQNIEALVAENNLKMEILPVNDLDKALHEFVNKDDKMAFYSCVQVNLEETRNKISRDSDTLNCEEEHLILKVGECLEDRVKERSVHPSDTPRGTSSATSVEAARNRSAAGIGSAVSFSDDEDTAEISKSATRGQRGSLGVSRSSRATSDVGRGKTSSRARGRGRGSNLKQTTLDSALGSRRRESTSASGAAKNTARSILDDEEELSPASSEETGRHVSKDPMESSGSDENLQGKGRKRAAPRGRGRGTGASSKRGRKTDNSSINRMLSSNNDDDDEDDVGKRPNKSQTRVTRNYGALRR
ncbi:double-strand break repair protein MRE11 [Rhodamnia argentea]|uniref:Double-strand break repair protein n=1 Tax=Rhodamnia argentea TaxID=178133 RepID=A0A8B8QUX8_9MYRT|nr:double-strand break repair protein MRE11 [Rhodamnia argentea]XP_030550997.1 double-strand break repair protein MRE11 [Rhodamnia argentea]XP_048130647.1 double-strand break repair protein MRE11 [Rhodamnia argentea]XP_048130648.1 double-strand break repair protein MRE11 [Rhodamnia argentea]